MKNVLFAYCLITSINSCSQQTNIYDLKNFVEIKRGDISVTSDHTMVNAILLKNINNPEVICVLGYMDSTYNELLNKTYFINNIAEGPYEIYLVGELLFSGNYKNGRRHGWQYEFRSGSLKLKSFYENGIKEGIWEEYKNGNLVKKIFYKEGIIVKEE